MAVIPPLVTGEEPGATPRIQEVSAVVSPSPDARAFSAASRRALAATTIWRRIWRKTSCNKLAKPLHRNGFQSQVPLHGMQGVSGSNPLGSIHFFTARLLGLAVFL